MKHRYGRAAAALALALCMAMLLSLSACTLLPWEKGGAEEVQQEIEDGQDSPEQDTGGQIFVNTLELPRGPQWDVQLPDLTKNAVQKFRQNEDTIGWLTLPGTNIDDVVVFYPQSGDNNYYLRKDFEGRYNDYGTYFVDYRCTFGEKRRWQDMSQNTCIYGHSMNDNPDGLAFSQIKKYLDADFARENPYIYFSTLEEDLMWEVFAVFYATINLPYNVPKFADFDEIMGEVLDRSLYNYDTVVTENDKLLTLSTCCYNYVASYPNDYRFVVMARLVQPGERVRESAVFGQNPSPKAP